MTKNIIQEISIGLILTILIISFLDPFSLWMPSPLAMTLLLFLVIAYVAFSVFMWREKVRDEREDYHRLLASRYGFLAGSVVLMVAVIVQGLNHDIDPWILCSLLAMVLAKVVTRVYGTLKK